MIDMYELMLGAAPEIFLALIAMSLLLYGVFTQQGGQATLSHVSNYSAASLLITLSIALYLSFNDFFDIFSYSANLFVNSYFILWAKILILLSSIFVLLMMGSYLERAKINSFEFPILVLFATLGMLVLVSANDLISVYMGLELLSLTLYVLAGFNRDSLSSNEAGIKYFVLGALASALFLFGCSFIYGYTGTTNFTSLRAFWSGQEDIPVFALIGLVFMLVAFCFKISAVPFHMWAPDVYQGAPMPVTAFFSVGPKIAALVILIRILFDAFGALFFQWQQIIYVVSLASMILGAFAAIPQTELKRLLAYSSIGHVGYLLMGLATGTEIGVQAILFYFVIYLFMNIGIFSIILNLSIKGRSIELISQLSGFGKTHPIQAASMAIFLFSMAGIPPLAGFFAKFYVLMAAFDAQLYMLAIIGILASVVAAYYYLRIIKVMYFDGLIFPLSWSGNRGTWFVLILSAFFIFAFFIMPDSFFNLTQMASFNLVDSLR